MGGADSVVNEIGLLPWSYGVRVGFLAYEGDESTLLILQEGCYLVHFLLIWLAYEIYALCFARIDARTRLKELASLSFRALGTTFGNGRAEPVDSVPIEIPSETRSSEQELCVQ
jgi:hypothetical protein